MVKIRKKGDDILKKVIIAILLITLLTLSIGCQSSKTEVDKVTNGAVVVIGYSEDDSEDIFGDLSEDEVKDIVGKITDRVSEDDEYTIDKKDSIIEDVFKENGIEDENQINAAKSKITISK